MKKDNLENIEEVKIEPFNELNYSDEIILGVIYNNKKYYYNSMYNTEDFVDKWVKQHDYTKFGTVVVVFGVADGRYIRSLRSKNKDMMIIVYEPSKEYAEYVCEHVDISDLIRDEKIILLSGREKYKVIFTLLNSIVQYENRDNIYYMVSPNYELIYGSDIELIKTTVDERKSLNLYTRNTILKIKSKMNENISKNFCDLIEQKSMSNLKKIFESENLTDIPALVVAAGPSLDKNIKQIKHMKNKALIIAVDTALNALAKEDIIPDLAVTVDPNKEIFLFESEKMKNVPLVTTLTSNYKIKDLHTGSRIYCKSADSWINKFDNRFETGNFELDTGGSVANDAYSIARVLGFKTIIFVGQDLAYPNDQEHTSGSAKTEANSIKTSDRYFFYVEDIYGGQVKTEHNMNAYRKWFEKMVQLFPDIRHIDATEGGAKKKGMEIMTLEEAINQTCNHSRDIDFGSMIERTAPYFTDEQKVEVYRELVDIENEMEMIRQRINNGKKEYEKLDDFNRKMKYTGKEFNDTLTEIGNINKWISEDSEIAFLTLYTADEDYEIREKIYKDKNNSYEEINLIVKSGLELLNSFEKATYEFTKDIIPNIEIAKAKIENV